jgi:hypothetical protein
MSLEAHRVSIIFVPERKRHDVKYLKFTSDKIDRIVEKTETYISYLINLYLTASFKI